MKKTLQLLALPLSALILTACDDSGSLSVGDEQVATQCIVLDVALKKETHFVHTAANVCQQAVNALILDSQEVFSLQPAGETTFNLPTATPQVAACFDPYEPDIKESNGKFQCRRI